MNDLFLHTLRDIYYAEKQIVKALPRDDRKIHRPAAQARIPDHLNETENHVKRLDRCSNWSNRKPKASTARRSTASSRKPTTSPAKSATRIIDAALIAAAQAVEHYEMTRYGTLVAWAKQLGRNDCTTLLQQTLDEEKATDKKLTAMAEAQVNRKAA